MPKLCCGCGKSKGTGKFTAGQWKLGVGAICRKCNDVDNPAGGGGGGGGGGGSKPTVEKSAKTNKSAWVPSELPTRQCVNPSCRKQGKGYRRCHRCQIVYYCSAQ